VITDPITFNLALTDILFFVFDSRAVEIASATSESWLCRVPASVSVLHTREALLDPSQFVGYGSKADVVSDNYP